MSMHWNVNCDGCGNNNLVQFRYKCLRCSDFDLCSSCFENKVESGVHTKDHPFQCLLDRGARELFFAGERIPEMCAESFTCPICGEMGFANRDLVKHAQAEHTSDVSAVICPICVAVPSAHPRRVFSIATHLLAAHGEMMNHVGSGGGTSVGTSGGSIIGGIGRSATPFSNGIRTIGGFSMPIARGRASISSLPRLRFTDDALLAPPPSSTTQQANGNAEPDSPD